MIYRWRSELLLARLTQQKFFKPELSILLSDKTFPTFCIFTQSIPKPINVFEELDRK